ncbi:MAG: prepilin peptidase [Eubacteriales bacterium]
MDFLFGFFVFVLGLVIGSFLNVCIYRIPNEKSIISPPSSCTTCNTRIKWYDLIPVLSYLILRGKCRSCGEKISPRYMLIELLTGILFLLCFLVFGLSWQFLAYIILTSILIGITFIDIDFQIIPDSFMIFGLIVGVAFVIAGVVPSGEDTFWGNIITGLIGMACGAGPLIIINLFSLAILKRDGIGGGDIKLMGVVGLFIGMKNILLAMVLGIIVAGVYSLIYMRKVRSDETEEESEESGMHEIPFGPFLALGCFVSMLFGQQILDWYLNLL